MTSDRARPIIDWLVHQGLAGQPVPALLAGFVERLREAGVDLRRAYLAGTLLHPDFDSFGCTWTPAGGVTTMDHPYDGDDTAWLNSPLRHAIVERRAFVRHNVVAESNRFPLFAELAAEGITEYVATVAHYGRNGVVAPETEIGVVASYATDRPTGFTEDELAVLADCREALALATRVPTNLRVAESILSTYLGTEAGQRILAGEIRRGTARTIDAAIVFADLRGFTLLADTVPRDELAAMLDEYLDCMADPVERRGGQVLKFMGDGMLATFAPGDDGVAAACAAAVDAAVEAMARVAALTRRRAGAGAPGMALDVALHRGEVLYGNVGSRSRMEFTVIGPAVNEAARIEALCGTLDRPLLASRAFVEAAATPERFRSLGTHRLRGVRERQELFTLPDGAVAPAS